jgi:hypothetical protein
MRATYTAQFFLLDFIVPIVFGEEYELRSCSIFTFLQPPVISSLFGPSIPSQHPILKYLQSVAFP